MAKSIWISRDTNPYDEPGYEFYSVMPEWDEEYEEFQEADDGHRIGWMDQEEFEDIFQMKLKPGGCVQVILDVRILDVINHTPTATPPCPDTESPSKADAPLYQPGRQGGLISRWLTGIRRTWSDPRPTI